MMFFKMSIYARSGRLGLNVILRTNLLTTPTSKTQVRQHCFPCLDLSSDRIILNQVNRITGRVRIHNSRIIRQPSHGMSALVVHLDL